MALTKSITQSFLGALNKPLGGSRKIPALISQFAMSAVPRGRGAYVPATKIIYVPATGTANLMRFDTVARTELAPLAVAGATSLKGVVYNPTTDRLYTIDIDGSPNNKVRKVNYNDGTSVALNPPAFVFNDLFQATGVGCFFTGNGGVQKLNNADVFTIFGDTFAPWTAAAYAMDWNGSNVLGIAGQGADTAVSLGTLTINTRVLTAGVGGGTHQPVSFGPTSGFALVGRGDASAANAIVKLTMNPAAPALSTIPNNITGQFRSGGYSPTFLMHFFFDQAGHVFILDDLSNTFKTILNQTVAANTTTESGDCAPVDTGLAVFMPSASAKIMNVFG